MFPEYYLLCVNNFDKLAKNNLDEWIDFLKNGKIKDDTKAPGLAKAKNCLDVDKLSTDERKDYVRHMHNLMYQRSVLTTQYDDGLQEGLEQGRLEGREEGIQEGLDQQKVNTAKMMLEDGEPIDKIMRYTGLTREQVEGLK